MNASDITAMLDEMFDFKYGIKSREDVEAKQDALFALRAEYVREINRIDSLTYHGIWKEPVLHDVKLIKKELGSVILMNELSGKAAGILYKQGIVTLFDASEMTEDEVRVLPQFGKKCVDELLALLRQHIDGFKFSKSNIKNKAFRHGWLDD